MYHHSLCDNPPAQSENCSKTLFSTNVSCYRYEDLDYMQEAVKQFAINFLKKNSMNLVEAESN